MSAKDQRIEIADAAQFGKVAVLMGGTSAEREISLLSGRAVHDALVQQGIDAHAVDAGDDLVNALQTGGYSRIWNALHGRGGEDGQLQGLVAALGIACTGSGVLGSALSMDKLRTKQLLTGAGFATPAYRVLRSGDDFEAVVAELGLPLMIKPAAEGSSLGLTKVTTERELAGAFQDASQYDCDVFAEQWVTGPEYTAGVLQGEVLPLIRIDAANTFYDYDAKYFSEQTRYICPCGLTDEEEREFSATALDAFMLVDGRGWGRVDFMLGNAGEPLILEINTVPGMTNHSLVPMAAAATGIDFNELVWRILETSFTAGSTAVSPREVAGAG